MDRGQKVQWMDEVITNGSSSEGSMDRGQYQAKDIVFELGYLGRDDFTNGSRSEGLIDRGQYQAKDIVFELGYLVRDDLTNGSRSVGLMDRGQYQPKDIVFELGYLGRDEDVQCLGSWVLRNSMLQWIFEGQEVQ